MKSIKRQILELIQPRTQQLAENLADVIIAKLNGEMAKLGQAFDVAISAFTSDLEEVQPVVKVLASVPCPRKIKPARPAKPTKKSGERRNHCKKCGAEGFQTKTCGISHNQDGPIVRTDREPKTKARPSARKVVAEDDSEARVVAAQPRVPQASPASDPIPATDHQPQQVRVPETRLIIDVPALFPTSRDLPAVTPKKTVNREKALKEIAKVQASTTKPMPPPRPNWPPPKPPPFVRAPNPAKTIPDERLASTSLAKQREENMRKFRQAADKRNNGGLRKPIEREEKPTSIADEEAGWDAAAMSDDDAVKISAASDID